MKRLSEILNYLPIAIYFAYIGLLLSIALNLKWFLSYYSAIENIDFGLCVLMLIHALFKFRDYPHFSKSSFLTILVLAVYHTIYYSTDISNLIYYFFYITILASNLIYIGLRVIIKP